jgi:hypothetical protein
VNLVYNLRIFLFYDVQVLLTERGRLVLPRTRSSQFIYNICTHIRTGPERCEMEPGPDTNLGHSSQPEIHVYVNIFNKYFSNQISYYLLE